MYLGRFRTFSLSTFALDFTLHFWITILTFVALALDVVHLATIHLISLGLRLSS